MKFNWRISLLLGLAAVAVLIVMLILFRSQYTGTAGMWAMIGFYGVAKLLEFSDAAIGS